MDMKYLSELPYVIHGSEDSIDRDVIYLINAMPKNKNLVHEFVNEDTKRENRNLAVLDEELGVIVDCYKGTPDAINNQIADTFHLHVQMMKECPVRVRITRNVPLKVTRSIRQLIGFVAQVLHHFPTDSALYGQYHGPIKTALKSKNFMARLECLSTLDYVHIFKENIDIKIFKSLGFQFAQTKAMLENNLELYSKKTVSEYDTRLEPVMYRREDIITKSLEYYLSLFNEYRDWLVQRLSAVQVAQDKELNILYALDEDVDKDDFYSQCGDGIIVDMGRERLVYYPPPYSYHSADIKEIGIFFDMSDKLRYATCKKILVDGESRFGHMFSAMENAELKKDMKNNFYLFAIENNELRACTKRNKMTFQVEII
jgi:hypothetical protein